MSTAFILFCSTLQFISILRVSVGVSPPITSTHVFHVNIKVINSSENETEIAVCFLRSHALIMLLEGTTKPKNHIHLLCISSSDTKLETNLGQKTVGFLKTKCMFIKSGKT